MGNSIFKGNSLTKLLSSISKNSAKKIINQLVRSQNNLIYNQNNQPFNHYTQFQQKQVLPLSQQINHDYVHNLPLLPSHHEEVSNEQPLQLHEWSNDLPILNLPVNSSNQLPMLSEFPQNMITPQKNNNRSNNYFIDLSCEFEDRKNKVKCWVDSIPSLKLLIKEIRLKSPASMGPIVTIKMADSTVDFITWLYLDRKDYS